MAHACNLILDYIQQFGSIYSVEIGGNCVHFVLEMCEIGLGVRIGVRSSASTGTFQYSHQHVALVGLGLVHATITSVVCARNHHRGPYCHMKEIESID